MSLLGGTPLSALLVTASTFTAFAACSNSDGAARGTPDSSVVSSGDTGGTAGTNVSGSGGRGSAAGAAASSGGTYFNASSGGASSNASSGGRTSGGASGASGASADGGPAGTISADHPGDQGLDADPRVLFHSDFETGFAGWTRHTQDASQMDVLSDPALANSGTQYLRAQVTRTQLAANQYISANAQVDLPRRVPEMYFRFYARFVGTTAIPHHWVRVAAGDPGFASDGLANTVPPGDQGFWYDLDARRDGFFNFYVYWYEMRSGRCNDGTAVPGCPGDQGSTYHYGNNFTPAGQSAFPRDQWFCLETYTKANTVGTSDGALALFENDALVGRYEPGTPHGRWLRDSFYSWGQYYADDGPFEGFDFRSSPDVLLKRVTLDAYYEKGTLDDLASTTPVPEAQVILYDDVVVATERIGCRVPVR
jgi:hypothetical protein